MPTVVFESRDNPPMTVPAPEGGALGDVCDDANAPVPFSCRSANCGTCRVEVLEGGEELLPAEHEEIEVLALFESPPTYRLACQAKMKPGLATLRLRTVDDDLL